MKSSPTDTANQPSDVMVSSHQITKPGVGMVSFGVIKIYNEKFRVYHQKQIPSQRQIRKDDNLMAEEQCMQEAVFSNGNFQ